jgi:hypothetical protein
LNAQDFNILVESAMSSPGLAAMRPVVEKEILHYDIFQALDREDLLKDLVFQGGTSLRLCRGSDRFSEDLDFAGGKDFTSIQMNKIKECVESHIGKRYGLLVTVKEPKKSDNEIENIKVDKWLITVETSPENRAMPRQKIKLEIANIPAYTRELVPLKVNYDFLAGMSDVLVITESMSEILADKVVAFPTSLLDRKGAAVPLTSNKIRHRDIWDMAWLTRKGASLDPAMVINKIRDYGIVNYQALLDHAIATLPLVVKSQEFKSQMQRFIDSETIKKTLAKSDYLNYLVATVEETFTSMKPHLLPVPKSNNVSSLTL